MIKNRRMLRIAVSICTAASSALFVRYADYVEPDGTAEPVMSRCRQRPAS